MDLCFTKRELSWLDDLMPESKKKKEDDKKKKEKEVKRHPFVQGFVPFSRSSRKLNETQAMLSIPFY
jgi:sodium bicarbonate cotransporter 8